MANMFRLKLFIMMTIFAVIFSGVISLLDYYRLEETVIENNQFQIQKIEDTVIYSLNTVEKAYYYFDKETADRMKENSFLLVNHYNINSNFEEWDFSALKKSLGVDIYIIDENNVITHSSFKPDIGLDFSLCCSKLIPVFEEVRESGEFFHEGLDIEQHTGKVKKYSYMATSDKKYLIQLGYSLENGDIFNEFNFINDSKRLAEEYEPINEINILNIGGLSLGKPKNGDHLPSNRRKAFDETLEKKKVTEVKGLWNDEEAIYRYVPYSSDYDTGTTKEKVIEIIYNNKELEATQNKYRQTYFIQLTIILAITTFISFLITRWVAKPMHLAFHDSLTGLKNRSAFDEVLVKKFADDQTTALMMIDLDNFKLVNDLLGHDEGDKLLKQVARIIRTISQDKDDAFRYGGDEFILIMYGTTKELAQNTAKGIIGRIKKSVAKGDPLVRDKISASIGIAFSPEHGDNAEILYKKADIALYAAKKKGKNRYSIYSDSIDSN